MSKTRDQDVPPDWTRRVHQCPNCQTRFGCPEPVGPHMPEFVSFIRRAAVMLSEDYADRTRGIVERTENLLRVATQVGADQSNLKRLHMAIRRKLRLR